MSTKLSNEFNNNLCEYCKYQGTYFKSPILDGDLCEVTKEKNCRHNKCTSFKPTFKLFNNIYSNKEVDKFMNNFINIMIIITCLFMIIR